MTTIRRRFFAMGLFGVLALSGMALAEPLEPQAPNEPTENADRFGDIAVYVESVRKEFGSPGVSVAIAHQNKLVWSDGFGQADVENEVPAKANTVYRIASISKTIATTAIMQLVESGKVDLDHPIQTYVPAFPEKGPKVTLRHLMSHTSGVRHYNPGEFEMKEHFNSVEEAIQIFKDDPLLFTPGTQYSYSSYAFNLLAGVVEQASGLTFEAYLQENIYAPAGMNQTHLEYQGPIVLNRARQYQKAGGGRVRNAPFADLSIKWAGGGIISTVEDLARFAIALDTKKLLSKASQKEMYTPYTLASGEQTNYGLGWDSRPGDYGQWVAHGGGATGGSTYILRVPEHGLAITMCFNVENAGDQRSAAMKIAGMVLE